MKIGILSLQGGIEEHVNHLKKLDVDVVEVRRKEELEGLNGLIIPGGESTTIGKLLLKSGIMGELKEKIEEGFPIWGTCAGMILLAKTVKNETKNLNSLKVMDITVRRNGYGTQGDSFKTNKLIPCIAEKEIPLVFIRAPYITGVGETVKVLCEVNNKIVAVRQGNILATSFHPELSEDLNFHKYFISLCTYNPFKMLQEG